MKARNPTDKTPNEFEQMDIITRTKGEGKELFSVTKFTESHNRLLPEKRYLLQVCIVSNFKKSEIKH